MCLCTVSKIKPVKRIGYGWKVFRVKEKRPELYGELRGQVWLERPTGTWLDERDYRSVYNCHADYLETSYNAIMYLKGWHIFATKQGATRWMSDDLRMVIRKVQYRKVVAVGAQERCKVIVARFIKIDKLESKAEKSQGGK